MGKLIGVIATVLVAVSAAVGVNYAVSNAASQDREVNLDHPATPNGMNSGSGIVSYGSTR